MMPAGFGRPFQRLARRLGLEPEEARCLALMGALIAVLMCAYTVAKVLRDALFLQEFGALALPYAYVGVALASAGYVWLESRLSRRYPGLGAARINQYVAIGCAVLATVSLARARHLTVGLFYLWTGAQAMMLLPHFWALALDVWDSRRARRLFPLLGGCGLIGGLAGGGFAAGSAPFLGPVGLMWVLTGLLVVARAMTGLLERHRARSPGPAAAASSVSSWEIIRNSAYIKVLALGISLSVIVGTLVDFQFKILIQRMYPDPSALTQFLGAFYAGLNAVSLLFQFGAAGWLLQRLGLGTSMGLQPGTVLVFTAWAAMTSGGWAVVAMRWLQGVISQTLGKSSTEIYYAAIRPNERRRIKPALDTLVERWSDAAVGILLLILLRVLHVPLAAIFVGTGVFALGWLVVGFFLERQYGRSFHVTLTRRWIEPEAPPESMALPSARAALLGALGSTDERQVLLALRLSPHARGAQTGPAVRRCLRHPSPAVKAAAVEAMEAMRLADPERVVEGLLAEAHEGCRRAAVGYLLSRGPEPIAFARGLLDGGDPALREMLLDALFEHPYEARAVLTWDWIDARMESGATGNLLLAARALGAMEGPACARRLKSLLANPDPDVRRLALISAARRPSPELLDRLLPLLTVRGLSHEALEAVAALGDAAVPALLRLLDGRNAEFTQSRASRALARIGSPRAVDGLMTLVRGGDVRLRHLGLRGLARVRLRAGRPVLPRSTVHRLFLRELRDYRLCLAPVTALENHVAPEVRLLGESFRESADRALERAVQALACWYDPKPLIGVFERLRTREPAAASPAMEYLGHVLPRRLFRTVSRIFETEAMAEPEGVPGPDRLAASILVAWETGDAWLRACAVRAARFAPAVDRRRFAAGAGADPVVRAEIEALAGGDGAGSGVRAC